VTTDLTALLAAIVQNPDEDTPRLAYADLLMESDDPTHRAKGAWIKGAVENAGRGFECYSYPQHYDVGFEYTTTERDLFMEFDRGFVGVWVTDAATFLRHADALVWYPGQTAECRDCGGDGEKSGFGCWTCARRGRVPRPCPPTAQPIRKVVLTTWPDDVYAFDFVAVDRADPGKGYTSPRWPGVEFELPGTGTTVGTEVASDDAESDYPPMDADEAGVRYT
jgi:uncharacterized protein (TIGR02996 family)